MSLVRLADPTSAPPWAHKFRSADLDEVRAFVGSFGGLRSCLSPRRDTIVYEAYRLLGPQAAVGVADAAQAITIRGHVTDPVLHLSMPRGSDYRVGRRHLTPSGASSAVLVPPQWDFGRRSPAGRVSAVMVRAAALEAELCARSPRLRGACALSLDAIDLTREAQAAWAEAIANFTHALRPAAPASELAHGQARLVELFAGAVLGASAARGVQGLAAAGLRRVEAWIDAHLGEPITLGRLCEVAGVGERSLQKAFETRRGMSPMRFVHERRIAAAYRHLSRRDAATSVKAVALGLGFAHLGRFAQAYRELVGELPSETLASRRQ
jgi:AraC-like DNA-binding protein